MPCTSDIYIEDDQFDITIADTEDLLQTSDTLKHKVIYLAGHLEHKFQANIVSAETKHEDEDHINSEFLLNLNRGGLTVPLLSTVHFIDSTYKLVDKCNLHCCRAHLS